MSVDPVEVRRTAEIWRQYVYWRRLLDLLVPEWSFQHMSDRKIAGFGFVDLPEIRSVVAGLNKLVAGARVIHHCPGIGAGLPQLQGIEDFDAFVAALDVYVATWIANNVA